MAAACVVFLLSIWIVGVEADLFFRWQRESLLKPKWIRASNEEGSRNITLEYDGDRHIEVHWFVNGQIISNGDFGIAISNYRIWYELSYNGVNKHWRRASILIPAGFVTTSLQIRFNSQIRQTHIDINPSFALQQGKSELEYVPDHDFKVSPVNTVPYESGNELRFHIYLQAEDMRGCQSSDARAEFYSINTCFTPPSLDIKTSITDPNFLNVFRPSIGDDLKIYEIFNTDNPSYLIRHVHLNYDVNATTLPRGVLKLTAAYRRPVPCRLFAGMEQTWSVFVVPAPYDHLFPVNTSVFDTRRTRFVAQNGDDLDLTVRVFGGEFEPGYKRSLKLPEVKLRKNGQVVQPVEVVKKLFETEAHFRFRNISVPDAGRYDATSTLNDTRTKEDFNIVITNTC